MLVFRGYGAFAAIFVAPDAFVSLVGLFVVTVSPSWVQDLISLSISFFLAVLHTEYRVKYLDCGAFSAAYEKTAGRQL